MATALQCKPCPPPLAGLRKLGNSRRNGAELGNLPCLLRRARFSPAAAAAPSSSPAIRSRLQAGRLARRLIRLELLLQLLLRAQSLLRRMPAGDHHASRLLRPRWRPPYEDRYNNQSQLFGLGGRWASDQISSCFDHIGRVWCPK